MSREDEILSTLDKITEQSKSKSKQKDNKSKSQQLYDLLASMDSSELQQAKKQIYHMIEQDEGEKRRVKEQLGAFVREEDDFENMFKGLT